MVVAPHPMVAGMTERDYYQGNVAMATPEQREWAEAREAALASSENSTPVTTEDTRTAEDVSAR
jgi:NADH-quinone oxidoreductase subunit I